MHSAVCVSGLVVCPVGCFIIVLEIYSWAYIDENLMNFIMETPKINSYILELYPLCGYLISEGMWISIHDCHIPHSCL
jgi:hypothetical protein